MTFQKLTDTQRSLIEEYKQKGVSHKDLANMRAKLMRGHSHDNGLFTSPKGETFKFTIESVAKPKAKPKAASVAPPAPAIEPKKTKAKPKAKQEEAPAPIEPATKPKAKPKAKEAPPAPANNLVVEFSN